MTSPRAVLRESLKALAVAGLVAACAGGGCTTSLADARDAKGSGAERIYDKPYDTVWNAVMKSIKSTRLELVLDNKEKGIILGQGKVGPFTHGENESEEHTSELQSPDHLLSLLLLEKKKHNITHLLHHPVIST